MVENNILNCLQSFSKLLDTEYIFHLGRAGKHMRFSLDFTKEDCYHLMGLHYLKDRKDNRGRNYIFDELMASPDARAHIALSSFLDENVCDRIHFTSLLESLLDDNHTIFRYNPKRLRFYTMIQADYLLDNISGEREVYLFLDKRTSSAFHFCRSIFPKRDRNYIDGQAKWTLLYKEKQKAGEEPVILYKHRDYDPTGAEDPTLKSNVSPISSKSGGK